MVARLKQNATKLCFAGLVLVAVLMALHHEGSMLSRYAEYVTSGMVEYSPTASGEADTKAMAERLRMLVARRPTAR